MESNLHNIWNYFLEVVKTTSLQTLLLLGPLIILALIFHQVAKTNENLSYNVLGEKIYLYGFAWLGTSVHELGHAIFAILFGHTVSEIKLFTPKSETGELGYIYHSWNKRSIFQRVGNFFIGIGPVLLGSIILLLLTKLLFKINILSISRISITPDSLLNLSAIKILLFEIWESSKLFINSIISDTPVWKQILFVYILYSVGSSITLSTSDVKNSFSGFLVIISTLLIINIATLWYGDYLTNLFWKTTLFFSSFYMLIILSIIINIFFIIFLLIISVITRLFR